MAVFGVASLACGLAQEPRNLVVARFVQGGGAAMASPAALSLITLMYTGAEERAKAFGLWGAIAGLGGTMGLVISGALTGFASWRWIFLINLLVAAIAVVLVPRLVTESRSLGEHTWTYPERSWAPAPCSPWSSGCSGPGRRVGAT